MRKYESPLTADLTPDSWQESFTPRTSNDALLAVFYDVRRFKTLFGKVEDYLKKVFLHRMNGKKTLEGKKFSLQLIPKTRKGTIDYDAIALDHGPEFLEKYRKPPSPYVEFKITKKE